MATTSWDHRPDKAARVPAALPKYYENEPAKDSLPHLLSGLPEVLHVTLEG
jgi:hypothetical protein